MLVKKRKIFLEKKTKMFASCVVGARVQMWKEEENPPCFLCDIRVLYRDIVHTSSHQGQFPISSQTIERDLKLAFLTKIFPP